MVQDVYCYPGINVLMNKLDLQDPEALTLGASQRKGINSGKSFIVRSKSNPSSY